MTEKRLKLDANKTELLIIGTPKLLDKFDCIFPSPIFGQNISKTTSGENLVVIFVNNFNYAQHISPMFCHHYYNF